MASTATGPDLSFAQEQVELLMDDECEIFEDTDQNRDSNLDTNTGQLTPPDPQYGLVFRGRCMVSPFSEAGRDPESDANQLLSLYKLSIPLDETEADLKEGQIGQFLGSRRDPELVGKRFVVTKVFVRTFAISRRLIIEIAEPEDN